MYSLTFRQELDEPIQRELDRLIARLKGVILKEHNADGSHKFDLTKISDDTLTQIIDAAQGRGQRWLTGPWRIDNPDLANPNRAGLDITLGAGTYHDWAPTGIDEAVLVEIDPAGDVEITGIKAYPGARDKRFLILSHVGSANTITLKHQDTGSIDAFRFDLTGDEDVELEPGQTLWCNYSPRSQRWRAAITSQAAGAVIPGGSSGGSQTVFTASLTLTKSQYDGANETTTIIPAPGAGKLIVPLSWTAFADLNGDAYNTSASLSLEYDSDPNTNALCDGLNNIIGSTGADRTASGKQASWGSTHSAFDPTNKAVVVKSTGNLSGGNANDVVYIRVQYVVQDMP